MIKINSFAVDKNDANNNNTTGFYNPKDGGKNTSIKQIKLWGQAHDHTKDINGDIDCQGDIKCDNISGQGLDFQFVVGKEAAFGKLNANGGIINEFESTNIQTQHIEAKDVTADNANIESIKNKNISSEKGEFDKLTAKQGNISEFFSQNAKIDNLTAKNFRVWKLIIDEINSVGGQLILSPTHAKIEHVTTKKLENGITEYTIYFLAEDDKIISNNFEEGDLIVSQTFNLKSGVNLNSSNRFYWMAIHEVGKEPESITIDGKQVKCYTIKVNDFFISPSTNGVPQKGDIICVLGNTLNKDRQNAIIISSVDNNYLDQKLRAPYICEYGNIDKFLLTDKNRLNYISNGESQFKGNFLSVSGENLLSIIKQTAENIRLALGKTGIDITTGKINFTADNFNFEGNLNLYDNKNNGLTIFDNNNKERINLQADSITDIVDFQDYDRIFAESTKTEKKGTNSWNIQSNGIQLTAENDNYVIDLSKIKLRLYTTSAKGTTNYKPNQLKVKISLVEVDTNLTMKQYINFVGQSLNQFEKVFVPRTKELIRFLPNRNTRQTYILYFEVAQSQGVISTTDTLHLDVQCMVSIATGTQTFIGRDGLFSHISGGKYILATPNELNLRFEYTGLKLQDEQIKVIAGKQGTDRKAVPYYISAYNYVPLTTITSDNFKLQSVVNENTNQFAYKIDVANMYGNLNIIQPPKNFKGDFVDGWVILPKTLQKDDKNDYYFAVPYGYTITIYNNTLKNDRNIYITGELNGYESVKFIDSNKVVKGFFKLDKNCSSATFTYVGTNLQDSDSGQVDYWCVK